MRSILKARLLQGYRTMAYPDAAPPDLPPHFVGRPMVDGERCPHDCRRCEQVCPTGAIRARTNGGRLVLDTGRCLFCRACSEACPHRAITFGRNHQLAGAARECLEVRDAGNLAAAFDRKARDLFGRSLKLREVSAGGCNACEADTNVLGTVAWDLGRFGIQFVASPRHADGILVTGPVPEHMKEALLKTYEAVPAPKIVIAVGACAISGGPYLGHPDVHGGADRLVPVDLYVPGCPPHPLTILDGLLRLLGRVEESATKP